MEEIKPKSSRELHREAMDASFQAELKKQQGEDKSAIYRQYQKAFDLERQAAMMLVDKTDCEPTRSVLFRSAAWLAIKANDKNAAIEMAELGLLHVVDSGLRQELEQVLAVAKKMK